MNAHRVVVCMLVAAVLVVGLVPVAGAQGPAADEADAIAAGLNTEPLPLTIDARMYNLPATATWDEVSAAYGSAMIAGGWTEDSDPAPVSPNGINALSWYKDDPVFAGFAVMFVPSTTGNVPKLVTLNAIAADDQGAAEGQEGMAYREIADCPCCDKVAPGTGGIWFQNYRTDAARFELKGPEKKELTVPAWTDDGPGCQFLAVKPGKYRVEAKTESGGKIEEELDAVDGQVTVAAMPAEGA